MTLTTNPAGLQSPTSTTNSTQATSTQATAGGSAQAAGLAGPNDDLEGGGGGGGEGEGGGAAYLPTGGSTQSGTQAASLPLGSENYLPPGGSGTGANIGTTGGSGGSLTVNQGAQALVEKTTQAAKSGNMAGVLSGVASILNASGTDDFAGMSVQAIIQKVLMEAYEGSQKDLRQVANQYAFYNNVKNNIRNEATLARAALANAGSNTSLSTPFTAHQTTDTLSPDGTSGKVSFSQSPSWNPFTPIDGTSLNPNTGAGGVGPGGTIKDKNTLSAYCDKLDSDLDTVGDNSQQTQTRIQSITNEQQQLMSNITQLMKNWNDVSMSIIHNI